METYFALALTAAFAAGSVLRPRYSAPKKPIKPVEPYLGEFVPPETPRQKQDRERWNDLRVLLSSDQ
jgi:hypothetical protein